MDKGFENQKLNWVSLLRLLVCLGGVHPGIVTAKWKSQVPNETFLMNTHVRSVRQWLRNEKPIPMLSRSSQGKLRRQYSRMQTEYELKAVHGTVDPRIHTSQYFIELESFSRMVFRSVIDFQISRRIERAERKNKGIRTFRQVQRTVENVVNGKLKYDAGPRFKVGTNTNLPKQYGRVWFKSFVLDGEVTLRLSNAWESEEVKAERLARGERDEMVSLSLNRSLGFWGLSSGATFWAESTVMRATLTKRFNPNFRAIYSAETPMGVPAYSSPVLQRLAFVYSGRF